MRHLSDVTVLGDGIAPSLKYRIEVVPINGIAGRSYPFDLPGSSLL